MLWARSVWAPLATWSHWRLAMVEAPGKHKEMARWLLLVYLMRCEAAIGVSEVS
jgi:hypothetical protein